MATRNINFTRGSTDDVQRAYQLADALTMQSLRPRRMERQGAVQAQLSPWEGVAQLGEAAVAAWANNNARKLAAADRDRVSGSNEELIRQLSGEKAPQYVGDRAGQAVQMPQDMETGRPMLLSDKSQALAAAMGGMDPREGNRVLAGAVLQRELAGPGELKEIDRGDRIDLIDETGKVVQSFPKGVTPDTEVREKGANARHLTPSGSAVLGEEGAWKRHQSPSGSAVLGANVSLENAALARDAAASSRDLQAQRFEMDKEKHEREKRAAGIDQQAKYEDVQKMQANVRGLLDAPGFDTIYGKSRYASPKMLPGGSGADAEARRAQLEAASFGISIQQMKGLGALSNAEGLKVTAAYTRAVDPKQSEEAAREAWAEVQGYLKTAQDRIASRGLVAPSAPNPSAGATGSFAAPPSGLEQRLPNYYGGQ